jgi:hypothetical protein
LELSELLVIGIPDLQVLKSEFPEIFHELFHESKSKLKKELLNKLEAIKRMELLSAK